MGSRRGDTRGNVKKIYIWAMSNRPTGALRIRSSRWQTRFRSSEALTATGRAPDRLDAETPVAPFELRVAVDILALRHLPGPAADLAWRAARAVTAVAPPLGMGLLVSSGRGSLHASAWANNKGEREYALQQNTSGRSCHSFQTWPAPCLPRPANPETDARIFRRSPIHGDQGDPGKNSPLRGNPNFSPACGQVHRELAKRLF